MSEDHAADSSHTGEPLSPLSPLSPPSSASPRPPLDQSLLHQAGDVLENLRSQLAELDRRERHVAAQTTALENERRLLRLSSQDFEERIQQREAACLQREEALDAGMAEVETSRRQLAEQQSQFQQSRDDLEMQRERLREEVTAELDQDRNELEREREALEQQIAEQDRRWQDGQAAIEQALAEERETRQSALEAELRQLAETVAAERSAWDEEQIRRQEQFDADAAEQSAKLRSELAAVREEQLDEIERRETNLQRTRVDLEKRTRFHETHLNQLRRTLEQQQTDLDRRRQLVGNEQVQIAESLDRQRRQLSRYRDRLAQREESLDRERHLLDDARRAFELKRSAEDSLSQQQRDAGDEERQALRADIRRQQDMLALHAQNLEARRARLDELRDDLEETHRQTLELRLVVEQVWAQLSQTFGEETTQMRVEQSRTELLCGYEKSRESLVEQQTAIDEAETRLDDQRDRFRHEREEFARWMSEREHQLLDQEQTLQRDIEAAAETEAQWRTTRERWTLEKIEAESVIRQLLEELDADLTVPMRPSAPGGEHPPSTETLSDESRRDDESSAAA